MQTHFIIFCLLKKTSFLCTLKKSLKLRQKKSENSPKINEFVQLQMPSGFIQNENVFNFVHRFRPRYFMSAPSFSLPTSRLSGFREIKSEVKKKMSIYILKKKRLFFITLHSSFFFPSKHFFFFFFGGSTHFSDSIMKRGLPIHNRCPAWGNFLERKDLGKIWKTKGK